MNHLRHANLSFSSTGKASLIAHEDRVYPCATRVAALPAVLVLAAVPTILELMHHGRRDANTISRTAREMIRWRPSQSGGFNRLTRLVAVYQCLIILNFLARV